MMTQTTKYLLAARLTARSVDIEVTSLDYEACRKSLPWIATVPNSEGKTSGLQSVLRTRRSYRGRQEQPNQMLY